MWIRTIFRTIAGLRPALALACLALAFAGPGLASPPPSLGVDITFAGTGEGSVNGRRTDGYILLGIWVPNGTLVATPDPGSRFAGWSGQCSPMPDGNCNVTCILYSPYPGYETCRPVAVTATFARVTRGDLDGDGRADLVWRGADESLAWWLMEGASATGGGWMPLPAGWTVFGTAKGGMSPESTLHLFNATTRFGAGVKVAGRFAMEFGFFGPVPEPWFPIGLGDFDGNGSGNSLWRRPDGMTYVRVGLYDGTPGSPGPEWLPAGIADLDGDGRDDIVWRHATTGEAWAWFMDGLAIASQKSLGTLDAVQWTLVAVADFDGDRKADLLWRHASGDTWAWRLDAGNYVAGASLGTPGPEWLPQAVADFDGDGKADIAWRRTDGAIWLWKMNGLAVAAQAPIADPGPAWTIAAP